MENRALHEPGVLASLENEAWSAIADAYPSVFYIASPNGEIAWVNKRWYETFGIASDADLSRAWPSIIDDAHREEAVAAWLYSIATGAPYSEELRARTADGTYRWFLSKAEAVRRSDGAISHWFGTTMEIDDRKEMERALLKSELRFRALTDNIEQIVFVADNDWNITYLNRRYADYTGIPIPQALGMGWHHAIPESEVDFVKAELERASPSGTVSHEHRLLHVDSGTFRWNLVRAHRVTDLTGQNAQWFGTITDVHDQKLSLEKKNVALDAFQLALLPRQIAKIPDCGVSTLYFSPSEEARIGGDWYDCFDLGDGRYGVSIGDVVGHGLEASAAMSRIRQYMSAVAEEQSDPVAVMQRTNAFMIRRNLPISTAIFGVLDTNRRRFQFSSAGHPPPVIVESERAEFRPCDGIPLGITKAASFRSHAIDLSEASELVLYTDGVLEFSRDILSAERDLLVAAGVAARLRNPSSRAAEIARRTLGTHHPNDDIAMLVFAFREGGGSTISHRLQSFMSWQFDSRDSRAAYRVREQALQFLRELSHPEQEVFEVKAVIGELIANALEHAPGDVHLEVDWRDERAVLRMRDHGPGFTANASLPPDMMSEDGRGLYVIAALADDLTANSHFEGGTEVGVRLRLHKHHAG